jgi:pimeloyl-ACP methyl ester carboxylesterase
VRIWWKETWHSFKLFAIHQPWLAGFPEPPLEPSPARPAVLFVHGYMCNRAAWRKWLPALSSHFNAATVNLEPVFGPLDRCVPPLHNAIQALRASTGAKRVTLVCHSMGGLAARAYLREHGVDAVQRVVTICTPHYGTFFARFGFGAAARQMRVSSDYLQLLAEHRLDVEFVCFASHHDNIVVPRSSQVFSGAEAVWFARIGHLSMITDAKVLRRVIEIIKRPSQFTLDARHQ